MPIYNRDGTPYVLAGNARQYDPTNPELENLDLWDQEGIERAGSPLYYYECMVQANTVDKHYLEDRGKIYSTVPVPLYCTYNPQASQNFLNMFGVDSPDEITFELNWSAVLNAIGHPPVIQSRLHSPFLKEEWVLVQTNLAEFKMWKAMHVQFICKRFQETLTTGEGKVTANKPYEVR